METIYANLDLYLLLGPAGTVLLGVLWGLTLSRLARVYKER